MKNKHWEAIHEVYATMEKLCGKSLCFTGDFLSMDSETKPEDETFQLDTDSNDLNEEDFIRIRGELRTQLDFLKATLSEHYSERDTYLILFPIVAQIDELMQTHFLRVMQTGWPQLQKELFQIDNAGEVFYEILDDILLKPQTPSFTYEVYFFCIGYGFRGRYADNPVQVKEYINRLKAKLQQEEISSVSEEVEETGLIRRFRSYYWNYAMGAGVLVAVYFILMMIGRYV